MKILFFAPHSAIWVHAFPEALVAEALQQHGHEIVYVTCDHQLQRYCVPMSAHRLGPDASLEAKLKVCARCDRNQEILRSEFGFNGPTLSQYVGAAEEEDVERALAGVSPDTFLTFERDGVAIGRLALYQLMLRRKRVDLGFSDQEWQEYLLELRNTLYAWHASRRILDEYRPDRILVYNAMYSVTRVCCMVAEQRGIPHYFMHAGGNWSNRLQTLMLGKGDTFQFMPHIVSMWPRFSGIPCSKRLLGLVTDHYLELLRGKSAFVYSSSKTDAFFDARIHYGVQPNQKLIVAVLGSYDEEVGAEMIGARRHRQIPLFETQIEWIKALLDNVSARSDLFLVIRVHPREFPNRRESGLSQHAQQLQSALSSLPPNAAVNWPAEGISLYDLADKTDVFLSSWSSVGKEMSVLGLPVVIYSSELPFYPAELNYLGTTRESYFEAIERALVEGWNPERARLAYRWSALEFDRATVFIGDSYPEIEHPVRPLAQKVLSRVRRRLNPFYKEHQDCRRRVRLGAAAQITQLIESGKDSVLDLMDPRAVEQASPAEETQALRHEIGRLANALYFTPEAKAASRLYPRLIDFANSSA